MRVYIPVLFGILTLTGCQRSEHQGPEVVDQTYRHRYGVEVTPADWVARGENGEVITTRRDGVVVKENFSNGNLHGVTTYTYPHSSLVQRTEEWKEGKLTREVNHYISGVPQEEIMHHGLNDKTVTLFYDNGDLWMKERMAGERLEQGEYYAKGNKLDSRVDQGNGDRMCRDPFGRVVCLDEFQNGLVVKKTTYHPNGNPKETTPYVAGHIEGLRRTFLPDGEPNTVEEWSQNLQHGVTKLFQNGEKITEVPYVFGVKQGVERRFSNGEEVVEEITWVNGTKHGPYNTYVGSKTQTDWYHHGKRVNKNMYDYLSKPNKQNS